MPSPAADTGDRTIDARLGSVPKRRSAWRVAARDRCSHRIRGHGAGRLARPLAPRRARTPRQLAPWLALCLLSGCSAIIVPPEQPVDPVTVFLLDHGRHSSLVLPAADRGMLRYSYGDWAWYAEARPGFWAGVRALFFPSRAGLGRRYLDVLPRADAIGAAVGVGVEQVHALRVSRASVEALRAELEALFAAGASTRRLNREYNLEFVEHPTPYTLRHNSNRVVADWLRRLDCEVRGASLWSRWQPVAPATASAH